MPVLHSLNQVGRTQRRSGENGLPEAKDLLIALQSCTHEAV